MRAFCDTCSDFDMENTEKYAIECFWDMLQRTAKEGVGGSEFIPANGH